jgi:hypothetical protein
MILNSIPLVDWGMGTVLIGVFAVVCVVLVLVILNLMNSDKKKNEGE